MNAFDLDSDNDAYLMDHTGKYTLLNPTGNRRVFFT
jgi:hypothetical protein